MKNNEEGVSHEVFFRRATDDTPPWAIGRPQPVIINLVERGVFHGEILDMGCGEGDNAVYIAKHVNNINITAIDLVPKTIEVVREKFQKESINIQCEVVDLLEDLSATNILKQHSYDIILDSAVFHAFSNDDRLHYIKSLEYLIKPGGLYIQLCFSEKETREGKPRRIKKTDLLELFSSTNGWTIESIEDSIYDTKPDFYLGPIAQAYLSLIRRNKLI